MIVRRTSTDVVSCDSKPLPASASAFAFPGKVRYHCLVTDGVDGLCIASVPGFADGCACEELVRLCEQCGFGREPTGHDYAQATVDLEVDACRAVRSWLLRRGLVPAVTRCMQATHGVAPLAFDDVFVVKYDATGSGASCQQELLPHCDAGDVSFMLALSSRDDYSGGGTSFDAMGLGPGFVNDAVLRNGALQLERGELLLFDAALRHAGVPIFTGTRYLLVGFCFTNDLAASSTPGNIDLQLSRIFPVM